MQSDKVLICIENDCLRIHVDEYSYRIDLEDEDGAYNLKAAIEHITSDTIDVEIEEVY